MWLVLTVLDGTEWNKRWPGTFWVNVRLPGDRSLS